MHYKFVVILFFLILSSQKVFMTAAEPDYTENIWLELDIYPSMNYRASVWFFFTGLSRPLNFVDFQSEPSFLGLDVHFYSGGSTTTVTIEVNGSKVSTNQGRNIADSMIRKLEQAFAMPTLQYNNYLGDWSGRLDFEYITVFPPVELRDIFLDGLPSEGFKQILASIMSNLSNNNYFNMDIGLGKEGGWSVRFTCVDGTKKLVPDKEQIISLKEITGYSGSIVFALESSSSTMLIRVFNQISNEYELTVNPISPTPIRQEYYETEYQSYYDIKGSIEDLSISLKITYSRIRIILLIILAQIITIVVSIILINRHKKIVLKIRQLI